MIKPIVLAKLRDALAALYPDENSSRRIVDDVGMNRLHIEFTSHAKNNWHAILLEAEKTNHINILLNSVYKEYGKNKSFREAYNTYYTFFEKGEQVESIDQSSISLTNGKRVNDHVYICYSYHDQDFVLELAGRLKKRGVTIWIDEWNITPGTDRNEAVEQAIHSCRYFIVILSPAMVESREAKADLNMAWTQSKSIVPILYQACRIPRQVQPYQYIDVRQRNVSDGILELLVNVVGTDTNLTAKPIVTSQATEEVSNFNLEEGKVLVWLRFTKLVAPRVKATLWHPSQLIIDNADGSCDFKIPVAEWREMALWVRGWGANVIVLKPEALRSQMRNEAKWLAQLYEN